MITNDDRMNAEANIYQLDEAVIIGLKERKRLLEAAREMQTKEEHLILCLRILELYRLYGSP